ncbi:MULTISPECIES: RNA polymerase factor sigma-54 [Arcicella]|uniref:RNA polymerase factor sigma-54 n=1 Tax=Arcicella lustrica TaxID=2984196 RepID=A0ABU5SEQ8_9BACT|nr:RNA polymerase factor sigma-54 [Arcicella sp. DC25W]MEA5425758.1 RNA polymerase factor sigma-54 [Arcicella sp. DC25W]
MMNLSQSQRQTFKITPLQIQMLNFLQLSTLELEERIKNELEENPLLEEGATTSDDSSDDFEADGDSDEFPTLTQPDNDYADWDEYAHDDIPDYKTKVNNHSEDDELYSLPLAQNTDWRSELKSQVHFLPLNEKQSVLIDYIIDSLTDEGFLTYSAENIADDFSFANGVYVDIDEVEKLLKVLRLMEPVGIGSADLQECLMRQLQHKKEKGLEVSLAIDIVAFNMDELAVRNYEKIMRLREVSSDELKMALAQISALNAKPVIDGETSSIAIKDNIIPDYIITYETNMYGDTQIDIALNNSRIPSLKINQDFASSIASSKDKAANQYVNSKINTANWLIEAIQQREMTMLKTMQAIVFFQKEFFKNGDVSSLKPMILKDVASQINMDISTISRVTSGKYAQTPFGIINLKDLFSEGIKMDSGGEVSNREIQQAIANLIANENKKSPFNDFQLMELLAQQGYHIARRTVAKYRENLNISSAQLRRQL